MPPRPVDSTRVAYPAGAEGDARVVVELVVDRAGMVTEARVVEGDEPFAASALAAARAWRFEPAHRGDVPVRARIRMGVDFHAPQRPREPEIDPQPPKPGATSARPQRPREPAPLPIQEIRIAGERQPPNGTRLGTAEVRQLPGVFGDPFRAIEVLPGVVPTASGIPFYFIRGAPPGNTGYFIDGIRVPALFHVAVGPSVVHPAMIDKVDLYSGPVPAEYGRYAAGVVAGTMRAPADVAHGEGTLRLFDVGGLVETPFADGRGTVLAAARYAFPGLLVPIFVPDVRFSYWDYQTRATWKLGERDTLGVFAFGTSDSLSQRQPADLATGQPERFEEQIGFTFHRVDLRLDHRLADQGKLRLAATVGYDRSSQEGISLSKRHYAIRLEVDQPLTEKLRVRGGWDAMYEPYSTATGNLGVARQYPARRNLFAGAWVSASYKPWAPLELVPSFRADMYASKSAGKDTIFALDPRLVARVGLSKSVTWVSAVGVAHQPPSGLVPLPGLDSGPLAAGLQEAYQWSEGVEAKLPAGFSGSATGFYTYYRGLTDASFSCADTPTFEKLLTCSGTYMSGRAYGLELLVRRALSERVAGLVSYTYSRSERADPRWFGTGPWVPSRFDRPHVANIVLTVNMGDGWTAGGRLFAYSGSPYSRFLTTRTIPPYNAWRLDPFTRLDLRLEKRVNLGNGVRLAFFAEGMNVLLQKESTGVECHWNGPTLKDGQEVNPCLQKAVGPISVPSIGIEGAF